MIEFAAGIMVGGSVGAVIMGALLSQARAMTAGVRDATAAHVRATMHAPQHTASPSARRGRVTDPRPMFLDGRQVFATGSSRLH